MKKDRSWTDEQLRDAVASSTSVRGVARLLGFKDGSGGYVARRIAELALDTSHFKSNRNPRTRATDDQLRLLIPSCKTASEVLNALGLTIHGANFNNLRKRAKRLGIDISHFVRGRRSSNRPVRWTDGQLREAVASNLSVAGTIRTLGLVPAGGNYDQIQRRIRELNIDTSHFTGQGWTKGSNFVATPAVPLEQVLVAGRWTGSHSLKQRLFKAGLKKPQCELCGWCERAPDGRIPVELDHINGDRFDNRLENLRILCPNCHSLQPTHRGLNKQSCRTRAGEDDTQFGWGSCDAERSIRAQINPGKSDNRLDNLRFLCPNWHSPQPTHRGLNKDDTSTIERINPRGVGAIMARRGSLKNSCPQGHAGSIPAPRTNRSS